jgi:hypothetical protein
MITTLLTPGSLNRSRNRLAPIVNERELEDIGQMQSRTYAIGSCICALVCVAIGAFEAARPHGDAFLVLVNYILAITLMFRTGKWLRVTKS